MGMMLRPPTTTDPRPADLFSGSASVAGSCDEPHDQSDQDEDDHAHCQPSKCAHAKSRATHHGEPSLSCSGISGTAQVSLMHNAKPTNW